MTVTELNGHRPLSDQEKRDRARAAYRADPALTGTDLGTRYGMSAEWGRKQIRAARSEIGPRAVRPNGTPAVPAVPPVARPSVPPASKPVVPRAVPGRHAARQPAGASVTVRRVTAAAVALVAVVAAAASYSHMHDLALEAGEGAMARALPLSVDGLVVAATMTLLSARRAGRAAGVLPWLALLLGLGASLAANVAAAEPTVVGRLVAAWPPVALALSFELLLRQTRGERG